jgi:hypothetical protein
MKIRENMKLMLIDSIMIKYIRKGIKSQRIKECDLVLWGPKESTKLWEKKDCFIFNIL